MQLNGSAVNTTALGNASRSYVVQVQGLAIALAFSLSAEATRVVQPEPVTLYQVEQTMGAADRYVYPTSYLGTDFLASANGVVTRRVSGGISVTTEMSGHAGVYTTQYDVSDITSGSSVNAYATARHMALGLSIYTQTYMGGIPNRIVLADPYVIELPFTVTGKGSHTKYTNDEELVASFSMDGTPLAEAFVINTAAMVTGAATRVHQASGSIAAYSEAVAEAGGVKRGCSAKAATGFVVLGFPALKGFQDGYAEAETGFSVEVGEVRVLRGLQTFIDTESIVYGSAHIIQAAKCVPVYNAVSVSGVYNVTTHGSGYIAAPQNVTASPRRFVFPHNEGIISIPLVAGETFVNHGCAGSIQTPHTVTGFARIRRSAVCDAICMESRIAAAAIRVLQGKAFVNIDFAVLRGQALTNLSRPAPEDRVFPVAARADSIFYVEPYTREFSL
jgi:hypothetical protein